MSLHLSRSHCSKNDTSLGRIFFSWFNWQRSMKLECNSILVLFLKSKWFLIESFNHRKQTQNRKRQWSMLAHMSQPTWRIVMTLRVHPFNNCIETSSWPFLSTAMLISSCASNARQDITFTHKTINHEQIIADDPNEVFHYELYIYWFRNKFCNWTGVKKLVDIIRDFCSCIRFREFHLIQFNSYWLYPPLDLILAKYWYFMSWTCLVSNLIGFFFFQSFKPTSNLNELKCGPYTKIRFGIFVNWKYQVQSTKVVWFKRNSVLSWKRIRCVVNGDKSVGSKFQDGIPCSRNCVWFHIRWCLMGLWITCASIDR